MVLFHEFIDLPADERAGKVPFIHSIDRDKHLKRLRVSPEIATLAKDRLLYWSQIRELAAIQVSATVRDRIASELEAEFDLKAAAIRREYEGSIAQLKTTYPAVIARRLAEGLIRAGNGSRTVADLLVEARTAPALAAIPAADLDATRTVAATNVVPAAAQVAAPVADVATATATVAAPAVEADGALAMEAYIETERCTTCNECTNLNGRMFAYNENKQAYIKDPKGGTFAQLVQAAERCPAAIIHPGTPLNPKEKDLEKWIKRAQPFN
jgi:pyruvate-ferredoxin/flavodoxin oxidoreductase